MCQLGTVFFGWISGGWSKLEGCRQEREHIPIFSMEVKRWERRESSLVRVVKFELDNDFISALLNETIGEKDRHFFLSLLIS
jgi:hypothetical protein